MNSEHYHLLSDVRSVAPSHKQAEALRVRLQYALASDEFYLEYQPQWNVHGHIQGAELLIRWQHPRYGVLLPERFMDALMSCQLGPALFGWLAERALPLLQRLRSEITPDFSLSLALPLSLAANEAVLAPFTHLLSQYGLTPAAIALIWQGSDDLLSNPACLAGMHALREQGYGAALAEYGEGYRQLAALSQLPLDRMHIPPGVIGLLPHPDAMVMVQLMLRLADKMAMRCCAQRVDSVQQFECLSAAGCRDFQGSYLFRPLSADQLAVVCHILSDADEEESPSGG
ncbi:MULTISPECIES: EAL domain-containing protein [Edwardsiella]|uniref:Diguanylate cyclase/phosphodiesterase with PAS/PAC and GAF sensor n=2 Tax=Edwardsiella anguillarum TaxID=1821960 RepID=A0A076LV10_9GAMM|nr:EAL domain-containing protein [Edwardsiella anguillarum]AKM47816.1 diguanylate cyclase [Edwardsiella sp. EA181011]GAJ69024.1 diguanylate cyclase/phosphodiesterase with PAS/PAC and GAF sensor [Edwardsiella piscicida]AIJ10283.1 diguanylate cyclase/phosphodiesterase with PAS/PAC and GAF sensor [Edwardsiella anguillarum ET080813]UOU77500.1 EAL domain-containing protein [Edwardsiella anguillarum]WHP78740.1 EAL domain-containing protein [Edwardsiella anguillarum]